MVRKLVWPKKSHNSPPLVRKYRAHLPPMGWWAVERLGTIMAKKEVP